MLKIPFFWHHSHEHSLLPKLLSPLGWIYGKITSNRANKSQGYQSKLPVICAGNITMGGSGKTPTSLAIAKILDEEFNKKVAFLSRGYGGKISIPTRVDKDMHYASECGDEPLFLSQHHPTYISHNRGKGAKLIEKDNLVDVIILDDGMQNPTLKKDLNLLIIDGIFGLGNKHIFPAGPLRESFKSAKKRIDAIVIIGDDDVGTTEYLQRYYTKKPIINASIVVQKKPDSVPKEVIAFAGIGIPKKFFNSAQEAGYHLVKTVEYGDHYDYSEEDLDYLENISQKQHFPLITTTKDFTRLPQKFIDNNHVITLDIELEFNEEGRQIIIDLIGKIL